MIKNPKRLPSKLADCLKTEGGKDQLFRDYIKVGGDLDALCLRVTETFSTANKSKSKYGFKRMKWLVDTYGQEKADKIAERKKTLGLFFHCISNLDPVS